jgi:hypothetical protein
MSMSSGVLLLGVNDVRVLSESLDRATVGFADETGATKLVRTPLHRLHVVRVEKGDRRERLRREYTPGPSFPVSLTLLPALLRSKRLATILQRVFSEEMDQASADALVASLEVDEGGRELRPMEARLVNVVSSHPNAEVRVGSLHVKWRDVPPREAAKLESALDISDVCSGACLALAHLVLWRQGDLKQQLCATRALVACPVTRPAGLLPGASATGELPST